MGEGELKSSGIVLAVADAIAEIATASGEMRLVTPGGRYQVRWDEGGSATAMGQLAFFAEFLEVSRLFERWVTECPMVYTSPNAPEARDVLGTWLLSILDGQWRYAHITGLRGDSVAPGDTGHDQDRQRRKPAARTQAPGAGARARSGGRATGPGSPAGEDLGLDGSGAQ